MMHKKIYIQNIVLRHTQQYHSGPLTTNPVNVGLRSLLFDFSLIPVPSFTCLVAFLHWG